jgi:hypothetical protein
MLKFGKSLSAASEENIPGRLDAESHLIAVDPLDQDFDVLTNGQAFALFLGYDQHGQCSFSTSCLHQI